MASIDGKVAEVGRVKRCVSLAVEENTLLVQDVSFSARFEFRSEGGQGGLHLRGISQRMMS